jgi:hypothetical protein
MSFKVLGSLTGIFLAVAIALAITPPIQAESGIVVAVVVDVGVGFACGALAAMVGVIADNSYR